MAETILIVDDDPDILELLKMNLEPEGYNIRMANDGERAVQSACMNPPDLILLDVMMPHKDGFQVHRRTQKYRAYQKRSCHFIDCPWTDRR